MRATEIVGWSFDGAVYCPEHKPDGDEDDIAPIFASDEGWESDCCDIPHNADGEPLAFETLGSYHDIEPESETCHLCNIDGYSPEGSVVLSPDERECPACLGYDTPSPGECPCRASDPSDHECNGNCQHCTGGVVQCDHEGD